VVRVLLATEGVNPDSKDKDGRTPLSWAAEKGHKVSVKILLSKIDSVNPNVRDKYGHTPLWWAAKKPK
jgi:ankyrin repeat protein